MEREGIKKTEIQQEK